MWKYMEGGRDTRITTGIQNVARVNGKLEIMRNFWSVRVVDKWNQVGPMLKF